jgi:hypothetical protein
VKILKCYYHPDREAVAVCSMCGKPLCEECVHEYNGKIYCKDCLAKVKEAEAKNTGATGKPAKNTAHKETEEKNNTAKIIFVSIVVALIIIGLILLSVVGIGGILTPIVFMPTVNSVHALSTCSYQNEQSIEISLYVKNCMLNIKEIEDADDEKVTSINRSDPKLAISRSENAVARMNYHNGVLTITGKSLSKNAIVTLYVTNKLKETSIYGNVQNGSVSVILPDISINQFKPYVMNGNTTITKSNITELGLKALNGSVSITGSTITNGNVKVINGAFALTGNKFIGNVSMKLVNGKLEISENKRITALSENGTNNQINCDFKDTAPPLSAVFDNITTDININVGKQPAIITAPAWDINADSYFINDGINYETPNYSEGEPHFEISIKSPSGAIQLGTVTLRGGE